LYKNKTFCNRKNLLKLKYALIIEIGAMDKKNLFLAKYFVLRALCAITNNSIFKTDFYEKVKKRGREKNSEREKKEREKLF